MRRFCRDPWAMVQTKLVIRFHITQSCQNSLASFEWTILLLGVGKLMLNLLVWPNFLQFPGRYLFFYLFLLFILAPVASRNWKIKYFTRSFFIYNQIKSMDFYYIIALDTCVPLIFYFKIRRWLAFNEQSYTSCHITILFYPLSASFLHTPTTWSFFSCAFWNTLHDEPSWYVSIFHSIRFLITVLFDVAIMRLSTSLFKSPF